MPSSSTSRRAALLRTAYLLTGTHEDAEDLVQVALVKAVPHWKRIAEHPEPYVRKVLAREAISRWRRRRWREVPTVLVPETAVAGPAAHRVVLQQALARDGLARLRELVPDLGQELADVSG
jgi:DNA-directed RNA polymerase specialized sigma24 family protein